MCAVYIYYVYINTNTYSIYLENIYMYLHVYVYIHLNSIIYKIYLIYINITYFSEICTRMCVHYICIINNSAVKRLIESKINIFVYIKYVYLLCVYINSNTCIYIFKKICYVKHIYI